MQALRSAWRDKLGGIDAYDGLVDLDAVDREFLRSELGHLPPDDEWEHLVFGRGAADQLAGVVSQIIATKIALELAPEGALRGVIVRAYATACEEDNDGAGPMYLMQRRAAGRLRRTSIPDVVILTEGTGDAQKGALGIYRGSAWTDADRGDGHGPVVPRIDAVGGAEPAGVRRRDHRRGGPALRRTRRIPRRPVPRPRHADRLVVAASTHRATARCPTGSRSASIAD